MSKFGNVFALFLLSLVHFLPFVQVSTASPTGDLPTAPLPFGQRLESRDTRTPPGPERNTVSLSQTAKSRASKKRMLPDSSSQIRKMKLLTFKTITMITPITGAAKFLEDFFSAVALEAGGAWQSRPRKESLTIAQGPFSLSFTSMGDSIPWDFVKEIAERLWETACMGAAELFDMVYSDEGGRIAVAISLRLADDMSSSSSGTDYNREGSVPSVGTPYENPGFEPGA